MSEQFAVT